MLLEIRYVKTGEGWLSANVPGGALSMPDIPDQPVIEDRSAQTNSTGKHPLWEGYKAVENYARATDTKRRADQVRTTEKYGRFYNWLVQQRSAMAVVEFGTAFGVSGMYWLSGLKVTGGTLFTFEPNDIWSGFAEPNLAAIGDGFVLTKGTFEDHAAAVLAEGSVDIGFIDAIHTGDFVTAQLAILRRYMRPGGLVLLDDINFSDDMKACWDQISSSPDIVASASVGSRVGLIELPR